jgi:hypothetical protein
MIPLFKKNETPFYVDRRALLPADCPGGFFGLTECQSVVTLKTPGKQKQQANQTRSKTKQEKQKTENI